MDEIGERVPPGIPGGAIACDTGSCERASLIQILGRGDSAVGAATEPAAIRIVDRSSPTAAWSARDLLDPRQKAEPRLFHGLDGPGARTGGFRTEGVRSRHTVTA